MGDVFGREMGKPIRDRQALGCGYVVIVGERYSSTPTSPTEPLAASSFSGAHLQRLAGVSAEEYERRADRVNLLGGSADDGPWDPREAELCMQRLLPLLQHRRVLLLGRRVSAAFKIFAPWFDEVRCYNTEFYCVPHPSGMNRWWNNRRNSEIAREFLSWALSGR